jgi:hypothetical protein
MPSLLPLPAEIQQLIINFLGEDEDSHDSLKTCSLVSWAFLSASRRTLFASGVLSLNNQTRDGVSMAGFAFERLLSRSPEIAILIRHLYYSPGILDHESPTFHASMTSMSRLKSLTITRYRVFKTPDMIDDRFRWNNHPLRRTLLHLLHLPSLESFRLDYVDDFSISDLVPCMSLRELIIERSSTDDHSILAPTFSNNLPADTVRLRELIYRYNSPNAMQNIATLHRPDGKPVVDLEWLTSLSLVVDTSAVYQSAQVLLARCINLEVIHLSGKNQFLKFDMVISGTHGTSLLLLVVSDFGMLDLSLTTLLRPEMTFLTKITLGLSVHEETPDSLFGLPSVIEGMRTSNILQFIDIRLYIETALDDGTGATWDLIDQAFSRPGWNSLKDVTLYIEVSGYDDHDDFGELKDRLLSLPETHLTRLMANESINFDFNAHFNEYRPFPY